MITEKQVLDIFYSLLKDSVSNLYKDAPADDIKQSAYTVINTLGVPADSIQTVTVNVNCYTLDLDKAKGIPDRSTLDETSLTVINTVHNILTDFYSIEYVFGKVLREPALAMHYANNRFIIRFLNN